MVNSDGNGVVMNDELRRVILELGVGEKVGIRRFVKNEQIWTAPETLKMISTHQSRPRVCNGPRAH